MDIISIVGSVVAVVVVLLIIVGFWTILWKFLLSKFPFIQAIVSGEPRQVQETKITQPVTAEQAQKEREARIAKRRTRKAE